MNELEQNRQRSEYYNSLRKADEQWHPKPPKSARMRRSVESFFVGAVAGMVARNLLGRHKDRHFEP